MAQLPVLSQLNLVVRDMAATLAFYRRLGWSIDVTPDGVHAVADLPHGLRVEFDTAAFAALWDSSHSGETGGSTVLGFSTATRQEVDEIYADFVAHGYHGRQPPYDAFWGSRYAMVDDPDGNPVGLMSPIEATLKFWPPAAAPPEVRPPLPERSATTATAR